MPLPRGRPEDPPFLDSDLPTHQPGRAAVRRESWFAGLGLGADSTRPQEEDELPPPKAPRTRRRRLNWPGRTVPPDRPSLQADTRPVRDMLIFGQNFNGSSPLEAYGGRCSISG